jgi:hypothetical protein
MRTTGRPILADRAYAGAGPWVTAGRRRPPDGQAVPDGTDGQPCTGHMTSQYNVSHVQA